MRQINNQNNKCPHCGAPLTSRVSHKCEYCRQVVSAEVWKEDTEDYDISLLRNIHLVNIQFEPKIFSYFLYFEGYYYPYLKPYKLNEDFMTVRITEPKRVGFVLEIEESLIRRREIVTIMHMLPNFEPREKENIYIDLMEKMYIKEKTYTW